MSVDDRILESMLRALPEDLESFRRACAGVGDWERLLEAAHQHGVRGVVHHYAAAAGVELPREVGQRLGRERFFEAARQRPLHDALFETVGALGARGIAAVPLKGPALAERLYPDPLLRPSVDLDLLVSARDLDGALDALAPLGFRVSDGEARERYHRRHHYHIILVRPGMEHIVELHFHAVRAFGAAVPADELIARAAPRRLAGGEALVLEPEDELVYLAVHAAKHFVVHLKWLYDLKLLVGRHPALRWEAALARARAMGVARGLAFGLAELRDRLGVEVPERATAPLGAARRRLARSLAGRGEGVARGPASTSLGLLFVASLGDGLPASAAVLWRGASRIAKRRAQRALPRLVPERWAG